MVLLVKGNELTVKSKIEKLGGEIQSCRNTGDQAWLQVTGITVKDLATWADCSNEPYQDGALLWYK